ncbi:ABC transporter substrate-binding protein [Geomonas nitrogeniifigens]|uniref:histidine kinase n=1 Tax=Geomonas diazotrophica TaxID=2843197 RepID=A0ABX8JTF7_9BACT|nr:ABC transporter substrate-binding protein [Geomonas nitrogeniifigens]QWV98700.1 ABC transporter substrate-binding protein [Geomonas nitrogeniifigens]QXE87857.1 ABC transporter substrate-binding protein [Geomonas nitrogeniifigens]
MKPAQAARRKGWGTLLALAFSLALAHPALALEHATIQLKWLHHFQFAGYYAALDKGFYREAGLDVTIREGGPDVEVEDAVTSGRADFGVGTSALLLHRAHGDDLVVLGQIFQHSPAILLTPRKTGIQKVADMKGRRFMYSNQHGDMLALLKKNGIEEKDIVKVEHRGDARDLVAGRADVMMAYSFNEPYILEQAGEPYLTFSPLTYGIDFYGDNFFTTRANLTSRPALVKAFREATLKGWRYALSHKEEIADLILAKYSRERSRDWLLFEANQMETLIQPTLVELGYQSPTRWRHIADTFSSIGMLPEGFDPSGIIYESGPGASHTLLWGALLICTAVIAVLFVIVMKFRQLNAVLKGEVRERKAAEAALKESEEQLRVIFDTSQAGIILVDPKGIIRFANNRMAEMFGCRMEELIGSGYTSHLHPDQLETGSELMRRIMTGELKGITTERHYLCGKGGGFWGYLSGRRLEAPDGELRALVGIISDISDRIEAEEARGKALMLVETLLAQSPLGILVYDGESGDCVRANQAVADITGGTVEELLRQNFRKIVPLCEGGIVEAAERVLADGQPCPLESEVTTTHGREVTLRFQLARFDVEQRHHLLLLVQDVTEEKRLDRENKRIETQMLNMQKLESLGVLAGGIAHDFNNILTGIVGNISFAQMVLEQAHKAKGPLDKAEKACQRAAELAGQLLTFARGGQPIKKVFSVKQLAGESLSLVLRGTNVKGRIEIPDTLDIVEADEGQMNQAFNNLIINAVHAMPGGGTLTVAGRNELMEQENRLGLAPGHYVRLDFRDEGCGISEIDQKKIFDPYFTTKASGTGLGLASTHSIVTRHGGVILVDSTPGRGATFTIYLPSLGESAADLVREQETDESPAGGGSVVVMDDEELIRDLACAMLVQLGYHATACCDGAEAVELYRAALERGEGYDAVIMDLTIPGGMGGKEAAQRILELDPEARLIVSSGYSNDPIMSDYKKHGFSATLEKPYTVKEIARVLTGVIPAGG